MTSRRAPRLRSLLAATLVAPLLVPLTASPALADGNGTIGGTVTDETDRPLPGICVAAFNSDGQREGSGEVTTGQEGTYFLEGLRSTPYRIRFRDCGSNGTGLFFTVGDAQNLRVYAGTGGQSFVFQDAPTITLSPGEVNSVEDPLFGDPPDQEINALIDRDTAVLSGSVQTQDANQSFVPNVCIELFTDNGKKIAEVASRDSGDLNPSVGAWQMEDIPGSDEVAGPYHVFAQTALSDCGDISERAWAVPFSVHRSSSQPEVEEAVDSETTLNTHQSEWWDNGASIGDANTQPINIQSGGGADKSPAFFLTKIDQTRGISGQVKDDSGANAGNVCVTAYDDSGNPVLDRADTSGNYEMALVPGSYHLEVHERCKDGLDPGPADDIYVAEFWQDADYSDDDAPVAGNAKPGETATVDGGTFVIPAGAVTVSVGQSGFVTVNPRVAKRGQISGTVTDTPAQGEQAQNLADVCVVALDGQNAATSPVPNAVTGSQGTYTITNLRPATYHVRFLPVDDENGQCADDQDQADYLPEYFDGANSKTGAEDVTLTSGQSRGAVNATLQDASLASDVYGTVQRGGASVADVCVTAMDRDGNVVRTTESGAAIADVEGDTGPQANYVLEDLNPGDYVVRFSRPDAPGCGNPDDLTTAPGNDLYVATEFHFDEPSRRTADVLTVGDDDVVNLDATVVKGARISGQVTASPAEAICVEVTNLSGTVLLSTRTTGLTSAESYAFEGVAPGTNYLVKFDDASSSRTCGGELFSSGADTFQTEWFDNAKARASATGIDLAAGQQRTNVNATMDPVTTSPTTFSRVSGYVEAGGNGNALNGIRVDVFRPDQDPAVDAPVFTTTTRNRTEYVAQRVCNDDPDMLPPDPLRSGPCQAPAPEEKREVIALEKSSDGYWEWRNGPVGIYKFRFTDPTGLRATEWFRSSQGIENAAGLPLEAGADVDLGERFSDRDNYNVDLPDDEDDDPVFGDNSDPGDITDLDSVRSRACRVASDYEAPTAPSGCDLEIPGNTGNSEGITDLSLAGTVSGRVTNGATGQSVASVRVDLLNDEDGTIALSAFTGSDGNYRIDGVAAGIYRVLFTPEQAELSAEYYDDQPSFGASDQIAVNAGQATSAINAELEVNGPPRAGDDAVTVEVNATTTLTNLLGNDTDPEGDELSITSVTQGSPHGTVELNDSGTVDFTPEQDNQDPTTFTYTVQDGQGLSDTATVSVTIVGEITGLNPVANDDAVATGESQAVTINVLANDFDPDGDNSRLTIVSTTEPFHGTASIVGSSIRYSPTAGFVGRDQFAYTIRDSQGFTASARVTVDVGTPNESAVTANASAGDTVATEGATATADNPIITTVTTPNAGTVSIVEEETSGGTTGDITLVNWRVDISAPNASASNPLVITFRLDGTIVEGLQPHRALRILRNGTLVQNCLGSSVADPDPCVSGRRMIGDDVFVTIRTSRASLWNFGFDNDAVVDRATGASGTGRVGTAVDVSRHAFSAAEVDTVLIARKDAYPDALAGAPLAHQLGAPLLLTTSDSLDTITRDEIVRLGTQRVVILGGTAAVSSGVENQLRSIPGVQVVDRIRGANRFETAAQIATQLDSYDTAYVVEGVDADPSRGWPDAVSVASLAAYEGRPILLVSTEELPDATRNAVAGLREAVIIGGTASVSTAVAQQLDQVVGAVTRVRGTDRYETSFEVVQRARAAGMSVSSVWVATGLNFPDALAAGPAVAKEGGVLILVNGKDYDASPAVNRLLTQNRTAIEVVTITGGTAAVSVGAELRIRQATEN